MWGVITKEIAIAVATSQDFASQLLSLSEMQIKIKLTKPKRQGKLMQWKIAI